jgi:hypothetical protein
MQEMPPTAWLVIDGGYVPLTPTAELRLDGAALHEDVTRAVAELREAIAESRRLVDRCRRDRHRRTTMLRLIRP